MMLHPFIPFFTEKLWLKLKLNKHYNSPLMYKGWNIQKKPGASFNKSHNKIYWLTELITNIRSTKANLDISPGTFIDISISELDSNKTKIINDNLVVFKRLGRISNINKSKIVEKGINIVVGIDVITLYFGKEIDLDEQKTKISKKANDLSLKLSALTQKLKNKDFLKNAPKSIVLKDKKSLVNGNIELKKLNSILNSIKN